MTAQPPQVKPLGNKPLQGTYVGQATEWPHSPRENDGPVAVVAADRSWSMRARIGNPYTLLELAVLLVSLVLAASYMSAAGHFTRHMLLHIGLMTVLAPLLASWMLRMGRSLPAAHSPGFLPVVTLLQLLLFFAWHAPGTLAWMMDAPLVHTAAQLLLLLVATAFWLAVMQRSDSHVWSAVVALVLTGKLFCLVALLLVFAPRVLYLASGPHAHAAIDLADQQLAGLLMIIACPLTYILAAVLLVARWLRLLGGEPRPGCV
jgi:putative membrane protein